MTNIWKKSLSMFLAIVMIFSMLPMSVFAEGQTEGETEGTTCEHIFVNDADEELEYCANGCGTKNEDYVAPETPSEPECEHVFADEAGNALEYCANDCGAKNEDYVAPETPSEPEASEPEESSEPECQHEGMTAADATCGTCGAENPYYVEPVIEEPIIGTITENMVWADGSVVGGVTIAGDVTITVKGTVTVTGTIRLSPDNISKVTFNGEDNAKLIRGGDFTGQMFYAEGASGKFHTLTFNNITLDGGAVWTGDVDKTLNRGKNNEGVKATGSVLYLLYTNANLKDSVLQNHDDSTGEKANAVFLRYYSTITFMNSVVRNNNSPSGYYSGGVITVRQGGTAKTYDSEVYGNSGAQGGFFGVSSTGSYGGICEVYDTKFHNNFANEGALFDMQCNSNKGYLLIDGCEFYNNASNRGLIYEHSYSRPVIIKDSYFHDNECAVWDCHADPVLDLSGKIVIEEDPDYTGYLFETPIVLSDSLAEGSSIAMSAASVKKLEKALITGAKGYAVTEADLAKIALPNEDYKLYVVDVNSDGFGDVFAVDPGVVVNEITITLKDSANEEASKTATVISAIECLPANPFAHEGYIFAGWVDADGNAVAKQKFTETTTLTATWKLETPVLKLSRDNATLKVTVDNKYDNLTYTYKWYKDNVAIEGATAETYTMTDINSATYKCEVTAADGICKPVTVSASGTSSAPAAAQVGETKYGSLKAAIEAANAVEGGATVTLMQNVTLGEKLTISGNVTISGAHTITRAANYTGTLFEVASGATLTLDGGLTIDGGNAWTFKKEKPEEDLKYGGDSFLTDHVNAVEGAPVATDHMFKNKGTLLLNDVTVQNSYATTKVGAFYGAANSVTVFDGATVSHIATTQQGAVILVSENNTTVTIKGNTLITNNIAADNGGIVYFYGQGGTMNLEGGRIAHNYSVTTLDSRKSSGTIFAVYSGGAKNTVNLSGTVITDNHAEGFGTMYIHTNSVFNMTGGEISNNTSYYQNVYIRTESCAATVSGGMITGNWAAAAAPDFYAKAGTASITGGTFTQDVSKYMPEGYKMTQQDNGTYVVAFDPTYGKVALVGETYYETLKAAIAAANAVEGGATVILVNDTTLGEKLTISGNVTISGAKTITRAADYTGTLFTVNAGATLTLDGGLTIDGANNWTFDKEGFMAALYDTSSSNSGLAFVTSEEGAPCATAPMIDINNGAVVANNVTIQNHLSTKGDNDGNRAVFKLSNAATLTMNGAKVQHCATGDASTVAGLNGGSTWTINAGTEISGNYGGRNGAMSRVNNSIVIMNGGSINNNYSVDANGSIFMMYGAGNEFIMNDGEICTNYAAKGGNGRTSAIYLHSAGKMTMNGGSICHNVGGGYGGVDSNQNSGSYLTVNDGAIANNVSTGGNSRHDLNWPSANTGATINGGTFTQDISQWLAPNCGLFYNEETKVYEVVTEGLYKLHIVDPATGEPAYVPYIEGNDLASLVATGKLFYADYYEMELEVLYDVKIDEPVVIDYPMTINLNSKTITGVNIYPVIRVQGGADVTVKNGTITNTDYVFVLGASDASSAGYLTIESGKYHGDITVASVTKGTLTINGGEFSVDPYEGSYEYTLNCIDANYNNESAKIFVKGGTFYKFNPADNAAEGVNTNFCDENYFAKTVDNGATYTVRPYAAQIGDKLYETLADAIAACVADVNTVVTLLTDIDLNEGVAVADGKVVTLDLNGKTIAFKADSGSAAISVAATLTLMDSSAEKTGKIVRESNTETSAIAVSGGNLIINSGSIESSHKGIQAGGTDKTNTITIEGGVIYGKTVALNLNKGTNTVSITGGELKSNKPNGGNVIHQGSKATATIEITDGKFDGFFTDVPTNAMEISGGTFTVDPSKYVAADFKAVEDENGIWSIVAKNYVAQVGETKYESLTEAIAAAKEAGTTVTVLQTIVLTEDGKLDLQGVRLNAAPSIQNAPVFRVLANVTVTNGIVDGRGPVEGEGGINCYAFIVGNSETAGTLTITSGTYRGVTTAISITNGTVNISGGVFQTGHDNEGTDYGAQYLLNCMDDAYKNGTAKFNITGGRFNGFNPADNAAEGVGTNFLSGNYKACDRNGDGKWYVSEANVLVTGTKEDGTPYNGDLYFASIYDALDFIQPRDTATIKLLSDFTVTADQRMANNYSFIINAEYVTLDLNGKTMLFDYEGSTATCYASFAIYNKGTLTILDSSEEQTGTIYNKTKIQGKDGPRILWVTSAGSATIEAGNFISEQGDTMFYTSNSNPDIPTTLYIKGGYFEHTIPTSGETYRYFNQQNGYQKQTIEVSGGIWAHDFRDGEMQIADDFAAQQRDDGTWRIVESVAKVVNEDGNNRYNWEFASLAEAIVEAEAGDTVTLLTDIQLAASVAVADEKVITLDLNGKTITGKNVYPVIRVQGGANVTVKNGTIVNKDDYVFVLGASDGASAGNLTIESGSYTGATTVASVTKGTLTIAGGEFKLTTEDKTYLLNCIDANYADGSAKIIVTGGAFEGFNPENNAAEGAGTNFCAAGYCAVEDKGIYTVVEAVAKIGEIGYGTVDAAIEAAKAGDTIVLVKDTETTALVLLKGIKLDLAGKNLTVTSYVAVFNGNHIIDSVGGGRLKVARDMMLVDATNEHLPIWDATEENEGYAFVAKPRFQDEARLDTNTAKYLFLPYLDASVYDLIAQGEKTSGVAMKVEVQWEREDKTIGSAVFKYTDELMAQFAALYPTANRKAFTLSLTGTANKDLTFKVFFESDTGVILECN